MAAPTGLRATEKTVEKLIYHVIYGVFRFIPDYDKEHTGGVTGQQRMPIPPWHLILPQSF